MNSRTLQNLDMNPSIIEPTGIIRIQGDSDSQPRVMKIEQDGIMRVHSENIMSEKEKMKKLSQMSKKR
jgi:hypothetical protein